MDWKSLSFFIEQALEDTSLYTTMYVFIYECNFIPEFFYAWNIILKYYNIHKEGKEIKHAIAVKLFSNV